MSGICDCSRFKFEFRGQPELQDLVPEEFSYCNTAGWPAQIAPVRRSGDFLFFSGLLGYEEPCKTAVKDSTKQVEMAFHWMDKTLKSAGIGWIDLVSVTSYHA